MRRVITLELIQKEVAKKGAKLLSKEYITKKDKLIFKCKCGEIFKRSFAEMERDTGVCKKCRYKALREQRKNDIDDIRKYVDKTTAQLLSKEYNNTKTPLKFKCECGDIFYVEWKRFKYRDKTTCNKCSNKRGGENGAILPETYRKRFERSTSKEYELLTKYRRIDEKVLVRHNTCGYEWKVSPKTMLYGHGCPRCSKKLSQYEEKIQGILKNMNINFVQEYTNKDFTTKKDRRMRFDFYLPNYNMIIEVDGRQHFEPIIFHKSQDPIETYIQRKRRDLKKNKYCRDNGIKLIRIPYYEIHTSKKYLKYLLKI